MKHIILELMVFLPLLGTLFAFSFKRGYLVTTLCIGMSSILSWYSFATFSGNQHINLFPIFALDSIRANWAINMDILSSIMLIVVSTISLVVHLYSIEYIEHGKSRFFSYLSLFTFCMTMLVVSDNFIQLFFGWEGVGLCSYLLIGFWFKRYSANNAAIKAFIVNRVGDFFLLIGIILIHYTFHSVEFAQIFDSFNYSKVQVLCCKFNTLNIICLLLFIGCVGKSAQLGLHVWLPDAMEGPTPASALIHAATMVTAGVFLIAKCSPLFEFSHTIREIIVIIGTLTAFFAATVAAAQNDIKKIIAYSTCSQLGYMFIACGLSAYNAAIFHLVTHAFFKALLFLGAGNIIHAMHKEQNIQKMGNCWKKIPYTYTFMLIGSLALSGIFPFAGFYSKDLIIEHAYGVNNFAFIVSLIVALLTAFYSCRLMLLVFHGDSQSGDPHEALRIHEAPRIMLIPLIILACGSLFSGIWGKHILNMASSTFWQSSLIVTHSYTNSFSIIGLISMLISLIGILCAYYLKHVQNKFILKFLQNKWYFDEIYEFIVIRPIKFLAKSLWICDVRIIDAFGPNGIIRLVNRCSKGAIKLHTGYIFDYVLMMFIALLVSVIYIIGIK